MIDIGIIREDRVKLMSALKNRAVDVDVDKIMVADADRRDLLAAIETKRAERNAVSVKVGHLMREIGRTKKAGKPIEGLEAKVTDFKALSSGLGDEIKRSEDKLRPVEQELRELLLMVPNIPHASVPVGGDADDNVIIKICGEPTKFDFAPKAHWDIGRNLRMLDFERAAKIARARFVLYVGIGARLERALINFMLDTHTREHGYTELFPPVLVNSETMTGTGQLPKFAEDLFKCADDDLWLIPTAEVPVTNIHRGESIPAEALPLKYVAYTPCFRREAGAHGRETRGLIRQHQFNKVELVKFVEPKDSYEELESLTENAETILRKLGLPYRVVDLCTGDIGFSAAKTYDLEVWMPGYNGYKEISSCSNFEDFQARRAGIRYRPVGGKLQFVHTLNGSGLAIGRTFAAILENYQQADGSVIVPEVLRPYLQVEKIG